MNKSEYLKILSERISSLPHDEYSNIMEYYTEYFEDAGEGNDEKVIEELGSPEMLAEKIMSEGTGQNYTAGAGQPYNHNAGTVYNQSMPNNYPQPEKQGLSTGWKVAIAIITFPIWIGIVAAIGGVIFGFGVATVACFAAGIATIIAGLSVVTASGATAIFFVGGGLLAIAVALGFLMAVVGMATGIVKLLKRIFANKKQASI